MKRWYAIGTAPIQVECRDSGFPNHDEYGNVQYENTHYDTEAQAWGSLLAKAEARISLSAAAVEEARKCLAQAEKKAADAVVYVAAVTDDHRQFVAKDAADAQGTLSEENLSEKNR